MSVRTLIAVTLLLSGCAASISEPEKDGSVTTDPSEEAEMIADSGTPGTSEDTGEAEAAAPVFPLVENRYGTREFRLKEDSCGIDTVAPVTSLMPTSFELSTVEAVDTFLLSNREQRTETACAVTTVSDDAALAEFSCESFRESYESPYGSGFDMEVAFEGELTSDNVIAGGLEVVLHCMAGSVCDDFARRGLAFPCTIAGDLILDVQ